MMFAESPEHNASRNRSGARLCNPVETSYEGASTQDPSLFRTILGSCGGFVESAAIFLGPSDCISCIEEPLGSARSPRSSRPMKKHGSSRARIKLAQKLKDSPSREGEVVDVPIKLVKSRSGKATKDETGQVYDPYRSFDDSISAISAHTLDEMARKYPKPLMTSLRFAKNRPRNGEELAPPSPARISSDSSEDSGERDQRAPADEVDDDIPFRRNFDKPPQDGLPKYELIENDIPFVMTKPKRRKNSGKSGSRSSTTKSNGPVDAHLAPTPKARGRKTKRRSSKRTTQLVFDPQEAEI
jgi:hypothetical protein